MKKYAGVLKRVYELESKKGINYVSTNGKLYKGLKIFYIIAFIYTMAINALFVLAMSIVMSDVPNSSNFVNEVIFVSICSALIIAGLVVLRFKKHLVFGLLNFIPEVFLMFMYANILRDDFEGLWGLKYSYYYKHGIPLLLMALLVVGMTLVALNEQRIVNKDYKKVVENLYSKFLEEEGNKETVSEEKWAEYLKNYDPDICEKGKQKPIKEKIFED